MARDDFLKNYQGSELHPRWLNRVSKLSAKGWKNLVAKDKDKVKSIRHEIQALPGETGSRSPSSARLHRTTAQFSLGSERGRLYRGRKRRDRIPLG